MSIYSEISRLSSQFSTLCNTHFRQLLHTNFSIRQSFELEWELSFPELTAHGISSNETLTDYEVYVTSFLCRCSSKMNSTFVNHLNFLIFLGPLQLTCQRPKTYCFPCSTLQKTWVRSNGKSGTKCRIIIETSVFWKRLVYLEVVLTT